MELADRDEGLEASLIARLRPGASDLEGALRSTTPAQLVQALFDAPHPYVSMFRDILAFFERASAQESRTQWNLQVDDTLVGLDHFKRFLRLWDEVDCTIEAPAVDNSSAWALLDETRNMPGSEPKLDADTGSMLGAD